MQIKVTYACGHVRNVGNPEADFIMGMMELQREGMATEWLCGTKGCGQTVGAPSLLWPGTPGRVVKVVCDDIPF